MSKGVPLKRKDPLNPPLGLSIDHDPDQVNQNSSAATISNNNKEQRTFLFSTLVNGGASKGQQQHGDPPHSPTRLNKLEGRTDLNYEHFPRFPEKVVGLKDAMTEGSVSQTSWKLRRQQFLEASAASPNASTKLAANITVEEQEARVRAEQLKNPFTLLILGNLSALKVMGMYLISLETIISCGLTAGLTYYWYVYGGRDGSWNGGTMNFILLAFAVTSPVSITTRYFGVACGF